MTGSGPHHFGAAHSGGWPTAFLFARNVELLLQVGTVCQHSANGSRLVNPNELAARLGVSNQHVLAYLGAWNRAAADGHVSYAEHLVPGVDDVLPGEASSSCPYRYRSRPGSRRKAPW